MKMTKNECYFYSILACTMIVIISFNSVRTETVEIVTTKEIPIEVIVTKEVEVVITECQTFDEAFKVNRELRGKHSTFFWNGKEYNSYFKEEI